MITNKKTPNRKSLLELLQFTFDEVLHLKKLLQEQHTNREPKRYYNIKQAELYLNCSRSLIYKLVSDGKLRAYKNATGGLLSFDPLDLEKYLAATVLKTDDEVETESK